MKFQLSVKATLMDPQTEREEFCQGHSKKILTISSLTMGSWIHTQHPTRICKIKSKISLYNSKITLNPIRECTRSSNNNMWLTTQWYI